MVRCLRTAVLASFHTQRRVPLWLLLCVGTMLAPLSAANAQVASERIILTVAGTGTPGFSGDGGPATAARFQYPGALAADSQGNLYVADTHNNRIRKIDHATGVVTTVAGTGVYGSGGDGGPATAAEMGNVTSIAFDAADNLFIGEAVTYTVRRIDASTGIVTRVAGKGTYGYSGDGGQATQAEIGVPWGIAVDGGGNLYIAAGENYRVRRVNLATGIISTAAGNGSSTYGGDGSLAAVSGLGYPYDVAVDAGGNLYIVVDQQYVRRVDAVSGIITTVAGSGTPGDSGDGGQATAASFKALWSVSIDALGGLYVADVSAYRIRAVDLATGLISTVAGTGVYGYDGAVGDGGPATLAPLSSPSGVLADRAGNLVFSDAHRVRHVSSAVAPRFTFEGDNASVLAGDPASFSVAFTGLPQPSVIWQVSTDAGRTFAGLTDGSPYSGVTTPVLAISAAPFSFNGYLYRARLANTWGETWSGPVSLTVNKRVPIITWPNPAPVAPGTALGTAQLNASADVPGTFVYDPPAGTVVSAGPEQPLKATFTPDDTSMYGVGITFVFLDVIGSNLEGARIAITIAGNGVWGDGDDGGPAAQASFRYPGIPAIDARGNLYLPDSGNNRIRKVDRVTGIVTTIAGTGVGGFNGDGLAATATQFSRPTALAFDEFGNLLVSDGDNNRVRRIDAVTGLVSTVAGTGTAGYVGDGGPATLAQLRAPFGLALDSAGNLYLSDSDNSAIRKVTPAGIITTIAGGAGSAWRDPGDGYPATEAIVGYVAAIKVGPDGDLYLAAYRQNRIRRISAATGIITTIAGDGTFGFGGDGGPSSLAMLNTPVGLDFDAAGNLFIGDLGNNRLRKIAAVSDTIHTIAGTGAYDFTGDGGPAAAATFRSPGYLAVDGDGAIFLGDLQNHRVRMIGTGAAPRIAQQPGDTGTDVGGTAVFAARVSGFPPPALRWQVSSNGTTWADLTNAAPYSGVTTSSLTITGATTDLSGLRYHLAATNGIGTATTASATLTVTTAAPPDGPPFTLTVTLPTGGAIRGAGVNCGAGGTACSVTMPASMTLGISATPSAGYTFTAWTGDCAGTAASLWVALNGPRTCGATFTPVGGGGGSYALTISPAPAGGTVTGFGLACGAGGSTCTVTLSGGTMASLTAAPAPGYVFTSWGGACGGTNATTTVLIDAARTCSATFTASGGGLPSGPPYTLTIAVPTGGTVSGAGINCGAGAAACSVTMPAAMTLGIGAVASAGYTFAGWTGDCTGSTADLWVALNGPRTCGATFAPTGGGGGSFALTIAPAPTGGTVTGSGLTCGADGATCAVTLSSGTIASLTAAPASGYVFTSWGGACSGTIATTTVLVDAARTCSATFTASGGGLPSGPPYTLTIAVPTGGTVSGAGINCGAGGAACSVTMPAAMTLGISAAPSAGFTFTAWTGDCTGTSASQWVALNGPRTCGATFTATGGGGGGGLPSGPPYTLTITMPSGGKVSGAGIDCGAGGTACSVTMPAAMTLGISATPSAGYTFTGWTGDCSGTTPSLWVALGGGRTCGATFAPAGGAGR